MCCVKRRKKSKQPSVWFVQLFSAQIEERLRSTALHSNTVHVIFSSAPLRNKKRMIENARLLVPLLPVCCS